MFLFCTNRNRHYSTLLSASRRSHTLGAMAWQPPDALYVATEPPLHHARCLRELARRQLEGWSPGTFEDTPDEVLGDMN